jgi:hypothetical protein
MMRVASCCEPQAVTTGSGASLRPCLCVPFKIFWLSELWCIRWCINRVIQLLDFIHCPVSVKTREFSGTGFRLCLKAGLIGRSVTVSERSTMNQPQGELSAEVEVNIRRILNGLAKY